MGPATTNIIPHMLLMVCIATSSQPLGSNFPNTLRLSLNVLRLSNVLVTSCHSSAGASSSQGPLPQGPLKARVVAADSIRAADSLKEVVVYKIRATDATREWTVSRRYSNFEQLHRQLRDVRHMTRRHSFCLHSIPA